VKRVKFNTNFLTVYVIILMVQNNYFQICIYLNF